MAVTRVTPSQIRKPFQLRFTLSTPSMRPEPVEPRFLSMRSSGTPVGTDAELGILCSSQTRSTSSTVPHPVPIQITETTGEFRGFRTLVPIVRLLPDYQDVGTSRFNEGARLYGRGVKIERVRVDIPGKERLRRLPDMDLPVRMHLDREVMPVGQRESHGTVFVDIAEFR
jgi:hypothetical protein